jgi:polysaccharide pyruvyl transferase WcaK-like protein
VLLAKARIARIYAIGVSVGPFDTPSDARVVGEFARHLRRIWVRDSASLERLAEIAPLVQAQIGFDPALLLRIDADSVWAEPLNDPVLGVAVCPNETLRAGDRYAETTRLNTIKAALSDLVAQGVIVRVLILNGHPKWGDNGLGEELAGALPASQVQVVRYTRATASMAAAIQSCGAVLAMRLHAGVMAFSAGVPFAQIAYHRKCSDFASEVALPDQALLPPVPRDSRELSRLLAALLRRDADLLCRRNPEEARAVASSSIRDVRLAVLDQGEPSLV